MTSLRAGVNQSLSPFSREITIAESLLTLHSKRKETTFLIFMSLLKLSHLSTMPRLNLTLSHLNYQMMTQHFAGYHH